MTFMEVNNGNRVRRSAANERDRPFRYAPVAQSEKVPDAHTTRAQCSPEVSKWSGHSGSLTIQALIRINDFSPAELGELEYFSGALFGETQSFSLQQFRRLAWLLGGNVTAEPAGDVFRLEISTDKNYFQPAVSFLVDA